MPPVYRSGSKVPKACVGVIQSLRLRYGVSIGVTQLILAQFLSGRGKIALFASKMSVSVPSGKVVYCQYPMVMPFLRLLHI